jgi:hypothetical protein
VHVSSDDRKGRLLPAFSLQANVDAPGRIAQDYSPGYSGRRQPNRLRSGHRTRGMSRRPALSAHPLNFSGARPMTSMKQLFGTAVTVFLVCAGLLAIALFSMGRADEQLVQAQQTRYRSYLLADELRQSSDDLTRLARTYVVSGDPMWEQQYLEVLDIRNGRAPRPAQYEKIYWDFRAAGQEPQRGKDAAVPLQQLMKDAGFTEV